MSGAPGSRAMDLVYIEWRDHYSDERSGWVNIDEEAKDELAPLMCRSVGWVLAENAVMLRLVANLDGAPDAADAGFGVHNIIKADIVKRKRLTVPR